MLENLKGECLKILIFGKLGLKLVFLKKYFVLILHHPMIGHMYFYRYDCFTSIGELEILPNIDHTIFHINNTLIKQTLGLSKVILVQANVLLIILP